MTAFPSSPSLCTRYTGDPFSWPWAPEPGKAFTEAQRRLLARLGYKTSKGRLVTENNLRLWRSCLGNGDTRFDQLRRNYLRLEVQIPEILVSEAREYAMNWSIAYSATRFRSVLNSLSNETVAQSKPLEPRQTSESEETVMTPEYLDTAATAALTGISKSTLEKWRVAGNKDSVHPSRPAREVRQPRRQSLDGRTQSPEHL